MAEKKVWLITGAGRGLGVDIARAALAAGHAVVATGRNATNVAAAVGMRDDLRRPQSKRPSRSLAGSTSWSTTRATSSPASLKN
jgi:NAD(P)-dependent dehydrogenase (short-subunit alcohol dehydrogenase family)